MTKKTGRNDLCPCGSGVKYKKCCYEKDIQKNFEEEDNNFNKNLTGTPLDEYFEIMRLIMLYSEIVRRAEEDGAELVHAEKQFIRLFKPGKEGWIPDSFFNNWLFFDFRFGKSGKTVCERFMDKEGHKLIPPGPDNVKIVSGAYFTFYRVIAMNESEIILEDLFTNKHWIMNGIGEPYENSAILGEIWFTRLVGIPEKCYNAATPYIFEPNTSEFFVDGIKNQVAVFMKKNGISGEPDKLIYAESCKDAFRNWVYYMLLASGKIKK